MVAVWCNTIDLTRSHWNKCQTLNNTMQICAPHILFNQWSSNHNHIHNFTSIQRLIPFKKYRIKSNNSIENDEVVRLFCNTFDTNTHVHASILPYLHAILFICDFFLIHFSILFLNLNQFIFTALLSSPHEHSLILTMKIVWTQFFAELIHKCMWKFELFFFAFSLCVLIYLFNRNLNVHRA